MSIHQENSGQSTTLYVSGRLDQEQTPQLEENLKTLLDNGRFYLVVDLSETTYTNSGGLRTLVSAWRICRQNGGTLALSGLGSKLQEIFKMVGFDKVFEIYESVGAAEKAVKKRITETS